MSVHDLSTEDVAVSWLEPVARRALAECGVSDEARLTMKISSLGESWYSSTYAGARRF